MDFKSLMAAQIAKSKPPPSKSPTPSSEHQKLTTASSQATTTTSKYIRRAELEAAREAAYAAEQAKIEAEREERAAKKRKLEDEEAERNAAREEKKRKFAEESRQRREEEEREEEKKRRKRLGLPELPDPANAKALENGDEASSTSPQGEDIPDDDELRSRLRELGEPTSLFDETHNARLKRYRKLTAKSLAPQLSNGPIPTILEPVPEKDMLVPSPPLPSKDQTAEHTFLYRQLASYFTLLLTEWSSALSQRSAEVKASSSGKAAQNAYLMVLQDLTPLFRHFERQTLAADLLEPICAIVRSAQHRRYVEANDGYLTLSIGKAAWPIGVTMVGIHERSAREKLHESSSGKQAHIMTDEVTRKFLQSIKRCISFAQTRWPPDDLGQLMG
jgi:pre-mRNA-splicing factor 18